MEHQQEDAPRSVAELLRDIATRGPAATEAEMIAHRAELGRQVEAAAREAAHVTRLSTSGVPLKYTKFAWHQYIAVTDAQKRVQRLCMAYAQRFATLKQGASLLLMGGVGTGKTLAAALIALDVLETHAVSFGTVSEMHREIRATYSPRSEVHDSELMHHWTTVPLLVIDEIGASRGSDAEKAMLFDVINARYAAGLPMVLTTNSDGQQLEEELGERMMDRLREICTVLVFDWSTFRSHHDRA